VSIRGVVAAGLWAISGVALLAIGTLVYLRIITPTYSRAIELVALSPFAMHFAIVALIASLAVATLSYGSQRKMAFGAAAVAVLATLVAFSWIAPLYLGSRSSVDGRAELVVMAQNLEYGDARLIADRGIQAGVDLLVVTDAPGPTVMQLHTMAKELPYTVGVGEWDGEGSVVLSRYPLTDVTRIADGGPSRVVTVHTPQFGSVDLVALHPTPPYQKARWTADYERITDYLRDNYAAGAALHDRPVVIAGDFNATLDHAPIRRIRAMGFTDSADQLNLGFQPTWPAPGSVQRFGISVPPLVQIDHVMTSPALVAASLTTFHSEGADHLGVLARLQRARL
jgi:endonuclease/exonuclease/phosphatase family metal-dependent hydrolase